MFVQLRGPWANEIFKGPLGQEALNVCTTKGPLGGSGQIGVSPELSNSGKLALESLTWKNTLVPVAHHFSAHFCLVKKTLNCYMGLQWGGVGVLINRK